MVESEVADSDYYPLSQISTLWHGARLFIRKDNSAVLEVGEFTTTEEGKHISHKGTKEYEGSAEVIALEINEGGEFIRRHEKYAFKFTQKNSNILRVSHESTPGVKMGYS